MAGPAGALIVGGKILTGAASLLYNSITGAKEAHAPTDVPKNKLNKYRDSKYILPRKALSSAEKSG